MHGVLLTNEKAAQVYSRFFSTFIDRRSFEKQQEYNRSFYLQYGVPLSECLWNCLTKNPKRISQFVAVCFLEQLDQQIYCIEDMGKPTKDSLARSACAFPVMEIAASSKAELIAYITDHRIADFYFFDETFEWLFVFTHEEVKAGRRLCLQVGQNIPSMSIS